MFVDQRDEVPLCISTECGYAESRIGGNESRRLTIEVSEIAAATPGHEYLFANSVRPFEHDDTAASIAGGNGAHQSGSATAKNCYIEFTHWGSWASGFFDKLRFEFHRADAADFAVDVMITLDQANVLDLRAYLDHR